MTKQLLILVPVYRPFLNDTEKVSIRRLRTCCPQHEVRVVCPEGLIVDPVIQDLPAERFEPAYFDGLEGYNRLMLSTEFYQRFADYEYILIHQTDAYLFRDELLDWCKKGYSYVGAPWLVKPKYDGMGRLLLYLRAIPFWLSGRSFWTLSLGNRVGNGGLSLRRVADFLQVCQTEKPVIREWLSRSYHHEYNEDCFWATRPQWVYPTCEEALRFSIDVAPAEALEKLGGQLPMGCHGWDKPFRIGFWKQFIPLS